MGRYFPAKLRSARCMAPTIPTDFPMLAVFPGDTRIRVVSFQALMIAQGECMLEIVKPMRWGRSVRALGRSSSLRRRVDSVEVIQ